ncbi:MAG: Ldh family oxidoreductase, partial [Caldilineaceae bacterium]|nr:Ldh family oxidoreductase [Caldilineaceae bacterium]
MPTFAADPLVHFVQRTFYAAGASEATAQLVAESLVSSNLGGHDSHGVIRVVQYLNHIHSGDLRAAAIPRIRRETSVITLVDGDYGFGQAAAHFAMTKSIEKASEHGLSAAGLIDSQHVGRLGERPDVREITCVADADRLDDFDAKLRPDLGDAIRVFVPVKLEMRQKRRRFTKQFLAGVNEQSAEFRNSKALLIR